MIEFRNKFSWFQGTTFCKIKKSGGGDVFTIYLMAKQQLHTWDIFRSENKNNTLIQKISKSLNS